MDDLKENISKEVLDSLTMEDLWNSPRLRKLVEEKYPRAYFSITEPMREFGLFHFIKLAEAQIQSIKEATDLGSRENFTKRDVMYAVYNHIRDTLYNSHGLYGFIYFMHV